jgi:hypothetical protein
MKLRADEQGRLSCAELFRPHGLFEAEKLADGSVRVTELAQEDVPIVKPMKTKEGFIMLPVKLDRKIVSAAI